MATALDFPLAPFSPQWGIELDDPGQTHREQQRPGHVVARRRESDLTPRLRSGSIEVGMTNRAAVNAFLRERAGRPFRVPNLDGLWRCWEWRFQWVGPGTWVFSAEIKETKQPIL